jgi:hypothetical protein
MKKLLITIMLSSSFCFANAATTESSPGATESAPAFNNTQIKCGTQVLKDGDNVNTLADICKGFKFGKNKAGFLDDNSGKPVVCSAKRGELNLSSCALKTPQQ